MQSMVTIVNETIAYLKVTKTAEFQRIAREIRKPSSAINAKK